MSHDDAPVELLADEPVTYIPYRGTTKKGPEQRICSDYPRVWRACEERFHKAVKSQIQPIVDEIVNFCRQERPTQDSAFGVDEIPTALIVGRDRALLSKLLGDVVDGLESSDSESAGSNPQEPAPFVSWLDEADCNNAQSALRAVISEFTTQFGGVNNEAPVVKKASTTLTPFDMAKLVTAYEDRHNPNEPANLVLIIEQLEAFDTEVMKALIYACSKHLNSLRLVFVITVSDIAYMQQAFTAATRAMLDINAFRIPSGPSLCSSLVEQIERPEYIQLGEASVRILKNIIERTDGRVSALLSAFHLIYMEHFSYQGPVFDILGHIAASDLVPGGGQPGYDMLCAFVGLEDRKGSLADGFSAEEVNVKALSYDPKLLQTYCRKQLSLGIIRRRKMDYATRVLFHLTRGLYDLGAYRHEVPLSFLDLLELRAKGGRDLEKYATWMIKKGFESASIPNLKAVGRTVLDRCKESIGRLEEATNQPATNHKLPRLVDDLSKLPHKLGPDGKGQLTAEFAPEAKVNLANEWVRCITSWAASPMHPFEEIYLADTSNGIKEVLDPSPRSVILSALIRPGGYLQCECCDLKDSNMPENMASMPDTCALFQRSLEAGRLLNVADWFGAFTSIMQNENVVRTTRKQEPEPARVSRSVSRSRRATSSVHLGSEADAEGEVDEALEVQREHQARFLLSAHELEFLGLIQATGRRKEHVLRTVFETGD